MKTGLSISFEVDVQYLKVSGKVLSRCRRRKSSRGSVWGHAPKKILIFPVGAWKCFFQSVFGPTESIKQMAMLNVEGKSTIATKKMGCSGY